MAAQSSPPQTTPQTSSLSFTQGFLLGQLSIALLIFFFIKFFIFGEPPSSDVRAASFADIRRQRTLSHARALARQHARSGSASLTPSTPDNALRRKRSSVLRPPPPLTTATILAKTYYNVSGHQPESLDWFNVLVAQTIAQFRDDAQHDDAMLKSLQSVLNGGHKPDFLDEIKITEINIGEEFPIFSNCRILPLEEGSGLGSTGADGIGIGAGKARGDGRIGEGTRLQARMDVDLSDVLTLGVETKLLLNWPKPNTAILPVALAVSVVRFSGTLSLTFIPSQPSSSSPPSSSSEPPNPPSRTHLAFTFLDDYRLDLSVRSLLGSRSRLQDVPKIAQLVEARLHAWFDERCVEPRFQQIMLPSLWPRKRNTRGGETEAGEEDEDDEEGKPKAGVADSERRYKEGGVGLEKNTESTDFAEDSVESRMAEEGRKMREAEERTRNGGLGQEGMRWRGQDPERDRSRSRDMRMPGAMPGA
ncbi:hypothetical protein K402DRAFT_394154 [Aulographum hederae CBS 113979]|uniref:Maintenance of mitochondrial morphology protein 1 n=1 Tax=Aulographum hederae CBS 113979 TaxID=1176131 RepID=A0A6G1GY93_9PEZI|nr:hypothetical protein K402DRAFT_394154 [Aulographum hederae CBS 113979]